jgi:hypothetical protein
VFSWIWMGWSIYIYMYIIYGSMILIYFSDI